ncbi:metallophosphoesterase family protein [Alkalicoccobacillus murimartini]|uniref:Phosphoesterase n=1 Tax=Alkalicoccobacillus murimartini TaxID=171685 RepID=A0ABT9YJK2_9BACI|nr:metallophosphoesterase [Alkalicoccobacillus murimartini]MDQ0208040.1 putative phosphoesterase [Alkalicoccobacillus murimartini]
MKVLIISDSHGWTDELEQVLASKRNEVDKIFHCGDSELVPNQGPLAGVTSVQGNCDMGQDFPEEWIEDTDLGRLYFTHGHLYQVKSHLQSLVRRAEEVGADVASFGHTHVATCFEEKGIVFINPGSIRLPSGSRDQTYCICELTEAAINVTYYTFDGQEMPELGGEFPRKNK